MLSNILLSKVVKLLACVSNVEDLFRSVVSASSPPGYASVIIDAILSVG